MSELTYLRICSTMSAFASSRSFLPARPALLATNLAGTNEIQCWQFDFSLTFEWFLVRAQTFFMLIEYSPYPLTTSNLAMAVD